MHGEHLLIDIIQSSCKTGVLKNLRFSCTKSYLPFACLSHTVYEPYLWSCNMSYVPPQCFYFLVLSAIHLKNSPSWALSCEHQPYIIKVTKIYQRFQIFYSTLTKNNGVFYKRHPVGIILRIQTNLHSTFGWVVLIL